MKKIIAAVLIALSGQAYSQTISPAPPTGVGIVTSCGAANGQLLFDNSGACAGSPWTSSGNNLLNSSGGTVGLNPSTGTITFANAVASVVLTAIGGGNVVMAPGSATAWTFLSGGGLLGAGSVPSNSGTCAITSQVGGNTLGTFVASGACAAGTYILGFASSTTNGWVCDAEDRTTITDSVQQIASTATNASFRATTASADVIQFKCLGY